jgi:hypothetical protein
MEQGNGRKKKRKRMKENHWKKRNKIGKEKETVGLREKGRFILCSVLHIYRKYQYLELCVV